MLLRKNNKLVNKLGKKTSIAILTMITAGAVFAAPFLLGLLLINISPSVPTGLWFIYPSKATIDTAAYVLINPQSFKSYKNYRDYPLARNQWGRLRPFIKQVGAKEGDIIETTGEEIIVNGEILPDSKILSQDKDGRTLTPYPLPYQYRLRHGEFWLTSNHPRGFDSRYLGTVESKNCRKVKLLIAFHR